MELVKEMKIQTYAVLFGSFRVASKIPKVFFLTNVKLALTPPTPTHLTPLESCQKMSKDVTNVTAGHLIIILPL